MNEVILQLYECLKNRTPVVFVIVLEAQGSTPQDPGSKMLVTQQGRHVGTVGGGRVENLAIQFALSLFENPSLSKRTHFVEWNLQKDVGMTCGGIMKLYFEIYYTAWQLVVFGAGHISSALIPLLLTLDCHVTCYDTRQEWLDKLPKSTKLTTVYSKDLSSEVAQVPISAFVILMTQGHATDRPVLQKFLERGRQPYLGVIGSKSKATVLRRELQENGLAKEKTKDFLCPIGLKIGSNHPQEIAVSIVAQLIEVRDHVFEKAS